MGQGNGALPSLERAQRDVDEAVRAREVYPPGAVDEREAIQPMRLVWYADVFDVSIQQEHLVGGLLITGVLFVVFGESNSGKTFFVLDLALAIARGALWRGLETQRGLVIYVAGEGAASVRNRVRAYRQAHDDIDGLPFAIVPFAVDFLSSESIDALIATIRFAESEAGERCVLVIVDTFARAMAGGDENSARDVGSAVAGADRIRIETGAAVGFVHHAGKDATKGARGSSALRAATDTEIFIEGQSGRRTATVTKQRDLEGGQAYPFDLEKVDLASTLAPQPVTSCVVRHVEETPEAGPERAARTQLNGKRQKQFVEIMRSRSVDPEKIWGLNELRDIARQAGMSKPSARSAVDAVVFSPYFVATIGGYRFTDGAQG